MTGTVPVLSIVFMAVSLVIGFALPIGLLLYFHIKKKADLAPFFVGCAVMLIFALVLESGIHRLVFASPIGSKILGKAWLYALYGGLMAGLFEETGRYLAFRTVLKKQQNKDVNALMYGAGHGGFECIVLLGITMINNIIWAVLINSGNSGVLTGAVTGDALAQVEENIRQLTTLAPPEFLFGAVERVFAITLQISLSILVWFAAKNAKRRYLYPVAILLHFAVDAGTVLIQRAGAPTILIEACVGIFTVLTAAFAKYVWKREVEHEELT